MSLNVRLIITIIIIIIIIITIIIIINNSNKTVLCVVGAHGTVKNGMVVNIKKILEKAIVTEI